MSSGVPSRFSGVCEMMRCRDSSSNDSSSGHRIGPGATALTRTSGASSRASERVRPMRPALRDRVDDVVLERPLGVDVGDVHDRALRRFAAPAPRPARETAARAGWCRSGRPRPSAVISPIGVGKNDDALLTSASSRPNVCSVCSTSDGSFAMSSRSAWISATDFGARVIELGLQQPRLAGGRAVVQHQARAGRVQPAADRRRRRASRRR